MCIALVVSCTWLKGRRIFTPNFFFLFHSQTILKVIKIFVQFPCLRSYRNYFCISFHFPNLLSVLMLAYTFSLLSLFFLVFLHYFSHFFFFVFALARSAVSIFILFNNYFLCCKEIIYVIYFNGVPFHKPYWLPRAPLPHLSKFCVDII